MRLLLCLFFISILSPALAQKKFSFPKLKMRSSDLQDFKPSRWKVIDSAQGDLNKDGIADFAFVYEYDKAIEEYRAYGDNETELFKEIQRPRILAIFFKTKDGYLLALQDNDFILRQHEGGVMGDPIRKMQIEEQQLVLNFNGGGLQQWILQYRWAYEKQDWYLNAASSTFFNNITGQMTRKLFDFQERSLTSEYGNVHQRQSLNEQQEEIYFFQDKKRLKDFKKPFTWQIMPEVYL